MDISIGGLVNLCYDAEVQPYVRLTYEPTYIGIIEIPIAYCDCIMRITYEDAVPINFEVINYMDISIYGRNFWLRYYLANPHTLSLGMAMDIYESIYGISNITRIARLMLNKKYDGILVENTDIRVYDNDGKMKQASQSDIPKEYKHIFRNACYAAKRYKVNGVGVSNIPYNLFNPTVQIFCQDKRTRTGTRELKPGTKKYDRVMKILLS